MLQIQYWLNYNFKISFFFHYFIIKINYSYPGLRGSPGGLKLTIKVAVSGLRSKGDWGPKEPNDGLLSNLKPENS